MLKFTNLDEGAEDQNWMGCLACGQVDLLTSVVELYSDPVRTRVRNDLSLTYQVGPEQSQAFCGPAAEHPATNWILDPANMALFQAWYGRDPHYDTEYFYCGCGARFDIYQLLGQTAYTGGIWTSQPPAQRPRRRVGRHRSDD